MVSVKSHGSKAGAEQKPAAASASNFVDVATITNSHGIIAIISQHRWDGSLTFGVFRQWERNGELVKTSFVPESMGEVFKDVTAQAIDRMRQLRETPGALPFPTIRP